MQSFVMITKISYKNKVFVLFILCNIGLAEVNADKSKDKCVENCLNGNCDDAGNCVCDFCWDGSKCERFVDRYPPEFDVNQKRIYINTENIDKQKPIFVAKAHDLDLKITCGQKKKGCICSDITYELIGQNFDQKLFKLNSKTGELFLIETENPINDFKYETLIRAKPAFNKTDSKGSELHLTLIFQNQLNRIKREAKEDTPLVNTNKDPISRQITNFQTTFTLRTLSGDPNALIIGNTVQYRLDVSLPRTSGIDLLIEIYTKDVINDEFLPALTLFNISVSNKVAGIGYLTNGAPPKPKTVLNKINNNIYDRSVLDFGTVANNGAEGNKFSIFFSVALVRKTNMTTGSKHFVTIGAEYNQGSYVWVGVSQVTADMIHPAEDLRLGEVEIKGTQTIALDSGFTFTAEALLEFRSDNVIFEMWGPSHAWEPDNIIAMGQIGVNHFGDNYQTIPNQPQHYNTKRFESQSRLSFQKAVLDMGLVTNIGEKVGKPSADSNNKLVFSFTIFAINYEENVGKTAPINMQIIIGNKTVWTQTLDVKINERKTEKSIARLLNSNANIYPMTGFQGSLTKLTLFTDFSESNTFIEFSVALEVPTARKLSLIEPCSARFVKELTGINIPYVESKQIEPIIEGNQYLFSFGRIQMIRQRSPSKKEDNTLVTEVVLKIAFHEENIEGKSLTPNVKVISGLKSIKVKTEEIGIIAENKSSIPEIIVKKAVPWDELYFDGGMSVNVDMKLPTGAAYEDVKLEVHGNNGTALVLPELSICRLEVTNVGQSLPCSSVCKKKVNKNKVSYERLTNKNTTLNDYSSVSLGDVSVEQIPSPETDRNFNLNFVATILDGSGFQSGIEYPLFVGLTMQTKLVWSTNVSFPIRYESPPDIPSDKRPNLMSYLKDKTPVIPGYTTEVVIRLETPPKTITNYSLEVITTDEEVSICGLWITHIGRNMACLSKHTKADYELRTIGENSKAVMDFKIIANTGPNYLMSSKDETYANTIEFTAMVRVKGTAKENKLITILAKYGQNILSIDNSLEIPVNGENSKTKKEFRPPKLFTFDTIDSSRVVGIGTSALLTFNVELEANSQSPIRTELISGKGYEICDAAVIRIGSNYPCFSPFDLKKKTKSVFDLGIICNTFLNKEDVEENSVSLGVVVRFDDKLKEGQSIKMFGQGFVGDSSIGKKQSIELAVNREIEQKLSKIFEPKIIPKSMTPFAAKVRDKVWIAFNLTIPPQSTVKVRIEAKGLVEENRAVITVHGLRITSGGTNIACPLANANPVLQFESSVGNSQHDIVIADLGYLSNFGFSHAFGNSMAGDDDITIEVLAQITDHPMTDENSDHTIKMTAILGNETNAQSITASKFMRVLRSHSERPSIETEISINSNANLNSYDRNHVIEAMAIIKHSNSSTGEPANPALRLFLPNYLQFGKIISSNTREQPMVQNNTIGSSVDIVMPWILFPDVFVINFTLIVDPDNQRGYGKNESLLTTPYRIICEHFRVSTSSKFPCSRLNQFSVKAKSSECNNPLGMSNGYIKDCQISASSAVSHNYAPHLARYNSGNYWAPSIRFWQQKQYLQIDFLRKTRITRVAVQSLRGTRKVIAYSLTASDNNKIWTNVNNVTYLSYTDSSAHDIIALPKESRYYRFIIEEASDPVREYDQYIAVRLEFFGCYLESEDLTNTTCQSSETQPMTRFSDDSERANRHFSADLYTNVIYFCDSTSDMNQQVCYYSNSGGSTWNIIGRSIDSIEGYELSTAKVFAVDYERPAYLSSRDGIRWTPESFDSYNQTVTHPKFQQKLTVPALHKEGLRRMNLKVGNWKALNDGLYFEDNNVPKAYWNKCCKI